MNLSRWQDIGAPRWRYHVAHPQNTGDRAVWKQPSGDGPSSEKLMPSSQHAQRPRRHTLKINPEDLCWMSQDKVQKEAEILNSGVPRMSLNGTRNNLKTAMYPWNLKDPHSKSGLTLTIAFKTLCRKPAEAHCHQNEPETKQHDRTHENNSDSKWQPRPARQGRNRNHTPSPKQQVWAGIMAKEEWRLNKAQQAHKADDLGSIPGSLWQKERTDFQSWSSVHRTYLCGHIHVYKHTHSHTSLLF